MKDGNRSKAGKSGAGLGEKSEIKANAGIRVKDGSRSKAGKSGSGEKGSRRQRRNGNKRMCGK